MKIKNGIALFIILSIFICCLGISAGAEEKEDPFAVALDPQLNYLTVVNDNHPYVFNGSYDLELKGDLVYLSDIYGYATPVEKATALAFTQLQTALRDQGMIIGLYSGYRTYEDQEWVYKYYSSLENWANDNKVQHPGFSEHHTGLVLDIMILYSEDGNEPVWYTETAERQQTIPYFELLHETLADYGFIDRYPAGKEMYTGVPCEPYEIRFVGSSAIAHIITDNNLCLEEYLYGE